jgi:hypothetical protein
MSVDTSHKDLIFPSDQLKYILHNLNAAFYSLEKQQGKLNINTEVFVNQKKKINYLIIGVLCLISGAVTYLFNKDATY